MPELVRPASDNFLKWVQAHERAWGNQSYTGRPTLEEMLTSPVVVFWQRAGMEKTDKHYVVTLHDDLTKLEKHFARMLMLGENEANRSRVIAVFSDRQQMRIADVRVRFVPLEDSPNP